MVSLHHQAFSVTRGAGERALPVAEQFGAHGLRVVLPARNSRPSVVLGFPPKGTVEPDPACEHGLPRPSLAEEQNRDVETPKPARFLEKPPHPLGAESPGVPDDALLLGGDMARAGGPVDLVERLDAKLHGCDRGPAAPIGPAVRLHQDEGRLDEARLGHQHPDGLHRRGTGADVNDKLAVREPSPQFRHPFAQELEDAGVVGRVVAVPWDMVETQLRQALAKDLGRFLHGAAFAFVLRARCLPMQQHHVADRAGEGRILVEQHGQRRAGNRFAVGEPVAAFGPLSLEGVVVDGDP